ncbi:HHR014Wp [Eremothecium sinecaudum]|uniref:HHR014Wp n=1 Tax=Eremothecium sinecaudum TaxID=45286 RepID=A0A109V0M4_9SACH|nr:HHR014Wp [Eremothecium sinecaudum]AMD22783.1 HHR014Wp [Eremothecium sinecaudum]
MSESCPLPSVNTSKVKQDNKPKPCCVCKVEKEERDKCLLFNSQESGKCEDLISSYKSCMKGYGFTI